MPSSITLFEHQVEHVRALKDIFDKSTIGLDFSMLGTGKTYTAATVAGDQGFRHVLVIAPVSVLPKWRQMQTNFGLRLSAAISFQAVRGIKDKQPSHGLLQRRDYIDDKLRKRVAFTPTSQLLNLVNEGALLVLDEIQNVKNKSDQLLAVRAIIECITSRGTMGSSRVLLMSGSPIDKEEHATNLCKVLGIMKTNELCIYHPRGPDTFAGYHTYPGYEEITGFMKALDAELYAKATRGMLIYDVASCRKHVYRLFQSVLKPVVSHAMPPQPMAVPLKKYNGMFAAATAVERDAIRSSVAMRKKATRFNNETGTVDYGHNGTETLTAITNALMKLERAKADMFERITRAELSKGPTHKAVVCFNYTESIQALAGKFADFKPLILRGCLSQQQRQAVIDLFQAPDTRHRLLITNLQVASTGIDLDDKHGGFPRTCFASPMFNTITLYQLGHRFQRMDTKSPANIYMVYERSFPEVSILDALARKGNVMKETVEEQATAGVEFPCDYTPYHEPVEMQAESTEALNVGVSAEASDDTMGGLEEAMDDDASESSSSASKRARL